MKFSRTSIIVNVENYVDDINQAWHHLKQKGINAVIEWYDWGSNINIFDPDGNRIGIRDEQKFKQDINNEKHAQQT